VKTKVSVAILIVFSLMSLQSQTCCSGGIPLSNNLGLPSSEKGTLLLGLNYDYNNLNTLNIGSENLNDDSRLRTTNSVLLNAGYSITNKLSVESLFTWVNQRRIISQFDNENLDQTSGIGDAIFLVKYNFSNLLGENSAFNIGVGTKIPLGSSTETNDLGIVLNSDLQPGSNAWDTVYFSFLNKSFGFNPSLNFYSRLFFRNTGTNSSYQNDLSYRFGNEFQLFIGASHQLIFFKTLANPGLSFKYRAASKDKIDNFDLDNTGGEWISIIPNISVDINPKVLFMSKVELPIYSKVEGTQLTPTYRITFGCLISIALKQNLKI